jgi:DNA repair protein RAD50
LEKYSKALDNAILKYHSIKMDEINDTIGHLWNKTYQGTGESWSQREGGECPLLT